MAQWTSEQRANAATIVAVGRRLGASAREITIALMTAMQESTLRNIPYGDRDSIGLFQQRNPWGTRAQRLDPVESARMFFQGGHGGQPGLFDIKGRDKLSLTAAAQAVQVSAFPNAYAKWESDAKALLGAASSPVPNATISTPFGKAGPLWESGHHTGVDYAVPIGTKVYAATGGKVIAEGPSGGPYGTWVKLKLSDGYEAIYAHLSREGVKKGDTVTAGQQLGLSGDTGKTTGPHLHYEVLKNGKPVNPTTATFLPVGDDKQWWDLRDVPGLVKGKLDDVKDIPEDVAGAAASALVDGLGAAAGAIASATGDAIAGVFTAPPVRDAATKTLFVALGLGLVLIGAARLTGPAREKTKPIVTDRVNQAKQAATLVGTRGAGAGAAAKPKPVPANDPPPF